MLYYYKLYRTFPTCTAIGVYVFPLEVPASLLFGKSASLLVSNTTSSTGTHTNSLPFIFTTTPVSTVPSSYVAPSGFANVFPAPSAVAWAFGFVP